MIPYKDRADSRCLSFSKSSSQKHLALSTARHPRGREWEARQRTLMTKRGSRTARLNDKPEPQIIHVAACWTCRELYKGRQWASLGKGARALTSGKPRGLERAGRRSSRTTSSGCLQESLLRQKCDAGLPLLSRGHSCLCVALEMTSSTRHSSHIKAQEEMHRRQACVSACMYICVCLSVNLRLYLCICIKKHKNLEKSEKL